MVKKCIRFGHLLQILQPSLGIFTENDTLKNDTSLAAQYGSALPPPPALPAMRLEVLRGDQRDGLNCISGEIVTSVFAIKSKIAYSTKKLMKNCWRGALCRPKSGNGPKLETRPQFPLLGKPKTGNASAVSTVG